MKSQKNKLPALFLSHGAPTNALEEDDYTRALGNLGKELLSKHSIRGILVLSAHWTTKNSSELQFYGPETNSKLFYDFYGFPDELYKVQYKISGSTELHKDILNRFPNIKENSTRGYDHGVWVPLLHLFPDANLPVVQITLPDQISNAPKECFELGKNLSELREQGFLIVGSGGLVHNLGRLNWDGKFSLETPWAKNFEMWALDRIEKKEWENLLFIHELAPNGKMAHPTLEHFNPLLVVLGAASTDESVEIFHQSFNFGSLSMASLWVHS